MQSAYWTQLHAQLSRTDEDYENCNGGSGSRGKSGGNGNGNGGNGDGAGPATIGHGGSTVGCDNGGKTSNASVSASTSAADPWHRARKAQLAAAAPPPSPNPVPLEEVLERLAPEIRIVPVSTHSTPATCVPADDGNASETHDGAAGTSDAAAAAEDNPLSQLPSSTRATATVNTIGLPSPADKTRAGGGNSDASNSISGDSDGDGGGSDSAEDNRAAFFKFSRPDTGHGNICPIYGVLEGTDCYFVVQPYRRFTLQHVLMYDPAQISDSHAKPLFIVYQVLLALRSLHEQGIVHGNLQPSNITIDETLWVQLVNIRGRIAVKRADGAAAPIDRLWNSRARLAEWSLANQLHAWVNGWVTNYDYIMSLNYIAGRELADPNHHPMLPWVMDFTSANGGWRDLTKSKFRLKKGDEQLDITYSGEVKHHISDVLSELTFYVYLARQTPRDTLCQHVRSKWVPEEYPSSMERMYNWSPDECIPAFFTDPRIFESIHSDLTNLEVPAWADSAEDFVQKHMDALESDAVSAQLHDWIDLTFGYKLTGKAAIEAKNVVLSRVAPRSGRLHNHGMAQLFSRPHPPRALPASTLTAQGRAGSVANAYGTTDDSSSALSSPERSDRHGGGGASSVSGSASKATSPGLFNSESGLAGGLRKLFEKRNTADSSNTNTPTKGSSKSDSTTFASSFRTKAQNVFDAAAENARSGASKQTSFSAGGGGGGAGSGGGSGGNRAAVDYESVEEASFGVLDTNSRKSTPMQSGRTGAGSTGGSNGVDSSNSSLRAWQRSSSTSKKSGSKVLVTPEPIPLPYDFQPLSGLERVEATQKFMAGILATTNSRGNRTTEQHPHPRPHPQHKQQQQQHEHYDDGSGGLGGSGGGGGGAAAADIHVGGANVARPVKYIPGLIQNVFAEVDACAAGATHDDRVAADMRSFGCIIADMYLGDAHRTWCVRVGSSSDPRVQEDSAAMLFAQHASKLPACVRAGVEVLLKPSQGVTRPTTQTFLHAKNPDQLLAFPPYFNDLYSMLSEFHATPNARRADVVQRSLKLLLSITEEGFAIVLPLIVRLFEHPASWRKALDLFDTVASRLTPDVMHAVFIGPMTELHKITAKSDTATLVKLFGELLLGRIIDRFGPAIYVEEFLPFLIDGLVHPTAAVALAAVAGLQFVVKKLGAVITARFVVRPILRHLSKGASQPSLEVLAAFSAEFGEAFIFELYSPFLQTQVEAHSMKMVPKSEAVLSNCISLLRGTLGQLASQSLLGYFNHLSASVLQPLLQTLVSVQSEFPNGTRPALTRAMAELLMCVSQALGRENSQDVLLPVIQVFFSAFDWIDPESERSSRPSNDGEDRDDAIDAGGSGTNGSAGNGSRVLGGIGGALGASTFDSTDRGGGVAASGVGDGNSASPPSSADGTDDGESRVKKLIAAAKSSTDTRSEAFDAQMAAFGYSSFCQLIGQETMRRSLYNIALIEELMYDESVVLAREPPPRFGGGFVPPEVEASLPHPIPITDSDDFEYQVVGGMVGTAGPAATPSSQSRRTSSGTSAASNAGDGGIGNGIGVSGINGGGGSDGAGVGGVGGAGSSAAFGGMGMGIGQANHILNVQSGWRTHWDRQVQAKTKYPPFQFQQLQLQTFTGHSGGIKSVAVMDNESMFFSGSKDKTVKLWSAQHRYFSEDGRGQSCRRTYLGHRKAVHDVIYSPKSGHVISSDGSVHVWDPENGYCLRQFELGRNFAVAVTYILSSHVVVAATTESTLRFLDVRASSMAQEWQPSTGAHGTLRCVAVDPCNNWIAVGFSSGIVSLLDSRTGLYQAGCKAHDGDVLKIKVISSERFLTTSTDQSSALWQWRKTELCPMLIGRYKGHSDPVHCMAIYEDDLYTIAVNNRLACYNSFEPSEHEPDASTVRSTNPVKMKSFKGTISSFNILPLNQTVLLGSDTGTLSLWG